MKKLNPTEKSSRTDNWLTPPEIIESLGEFDLDPCSPERRPWNTAKNHFTFLDNGLLQPWENKIFVYLYENKYVWERSNVQNVVNANLQQRSSSMSEKNEREGFLQDAKNVSNHSIGREEKNHIYPLTIENGNMNYYQITSVSVQNVNLLNHLTTLIFLLEKITKQDLVRGVEFVKGNMQRKKFSNEEQILLKKLRSKLQKTNIVDLIKVGEQKEKEILSIIKSVDQMFLNGQTKNGNYVNNILETSVHIVNKKQFLLKIILFLYQQIIVPEQSQEISFQHAKNVIHQRATGIQMNGLLKNLSEELKNISSFSMKIRYKPRVWLNPPYSNLEPWLNRMCLHANGTALVFGRTDTRAFHNFVFPTADSILFIKSRLHFYTLSGIRKKDNCGAPSVLIAYTEFDSDKLADSGIKGFQFALTPELFCISFNEDKRTWKIILKDVMNELDQEATLSHIYEKVVEMAPKRVRKNVNYKAKVRQTLQFYFNNVEKGVWKN